MTREMSLKCVSMAVRVDRLRLPCRLALRRRARGGTMGLREDFGRTLRLALIGGGSEGWIGRMHRAAAEMDGWWQVVAGVFSSDAARSRERGAAMGFDRARSYGNLAELIARERERGDGVDAVAIM